MGRTIPYIMEKMFETTNQMVYCDLGCFFYPPCDCKQLSDSVWGHRKWQPWQPWHMLQSASSSADFIHMLTCPEGGTLQEPVVGDITMGIYISYHRNHIYIYIIYNYIYISYHRNHRDVLKRQMSRISSKRSNKTVWSQASIPLFNDKALWKPQVLSCWVVKSSPVEISLVQRSFGGWWSNTYRQVE